MIRSWINFLSLVSMLTGQALPLDAATAPAADIPIEIQARADSDQAPPTPATVHLKTALGKSGSERHRKVTVPGSFRFPIPPGGETFRLALESEHYFEDLPPSQLGQVYLLHHGQRWDLGTLLRWAQINGVPAQQNGLRLPRMAPGAYQPVENAHRALSGPFRPDRRWKISQGRGYSCDFPL
jgi:hypothetical protein